MDDDTSPSVNPDAALSADERALGMGADITRRDFLNAIALGTGAALLSAAPPGLRRIAELRRKANTPDEPWHPWTGYGGVGDYARSNGNTWEVVNAGHGIRDDAYERAIAGATSTGEKYDLVIVGGGFAGVTAAYTFLKDTNRQRQCLILENHPLIGGEAKRNEFVVRAQRLMGPQGSNQMLVFADGWMGELWRDIGLPTEYEYGKLSADRKPMEFPLDNYLYQLWGDNFENHGYFFDSPEPHWVRNPWGHNLEGTPWSPELRRDLLRWRNEPAEPFQGDETSLRKWLDSMTYDAYLTKVRKLHPEVARFADPICAAAFGPGSDGASALLASEAFPGFEGLTSTSGRSLLDMPNHRLSANTTKGLSEIFSYPGGNDGVMRAMVKWLNPQVIEGSTAFAEVQNGRIRFEAMDQPRASCRMRVGATAVRVVHDPEKSGEPAVITYLKEGKLYSVRSRTVIWAAGCWSGKHAIQRLPAEYHTAMDSFPRSPMMIVNVALDNWRFLYELGYTACSWRGGLGFTGNLRAPMYVGDYRPPLDPDHPALFTLYVPFPQPGLALADQGKVARQKMFITSYREFETQIRQQMVRMFGSAGFDPARDIAGIVLNRWGHAFVNAGPGFFYPPDGSPAPSDVLRRPTGSLTFAHSELAGGQSAPAAWVEARRAAQQVLALL